MTKTLINTSTTARLRQFMAVRALVLAAGVALAPVLARAEEARVDGHMTPLPGEELEKPVTLTGRCGGVVVHEWVVGVPGSERTDAAIRLMDRLCNRAVKAFPAFVRRQGLAGKITSTRKFEWNVALIPDGHCYRCMNDLEFRFSQRFVKRNLWAYTGLYERYIFLFNQVYEAGQPKPIWRRAWVHELFHALSMHYGIFQAHADNDWARVETDERYARQFERAVPGP